VKYLPKEALRPVRGAEAMRVVRTVDDGPKTDQAPERWSAGT